MQAVMTVQRAARTPRDARKLCNELSKAEPNRYKKIRIVKATYDPVKYFTKGPTPQSRTVLAQCGKTSRTHKSGENGHRP